MPQCMFPTCTAPKQTERSWAGTCPFQKAGSPSSARIQRDAWNRPQYFPSGCLDDTRSICNCVRKEGCVVSDRGKRTFCYRHSCVGRNAHMHMHTHTHTHTVVSHSLANAEHIISVCCHGHQCVVRNWACPVVSEGPGVVLWLTSKECSTTKQWLVAMKQTSSGQKQLDFSESHNTELFVSSHKSLGSGYHAQITELYVYQNH